MPGLYLSAHLSAGAEDDEDSADLSVAERALLLAWVRLHRPGALPSAIKTPSLDLPTPSPAYLLEQEVRYFGSSTALAHLVLWVVGRLAPSQARERWYAAFCEAERASGFASTAWTDATKEGEEKRLFQALSEAFSEAAAWDRTTGVGLPTLARLVGFSLFRSSAPSKAEASKGPAAPVEALLAACEAAGAKFEHIVRAYLRDQVARGVALPTRLLSLIERHPTPLSHSALGIDDLGSRAGSETSSSATSTSAALQTARHERALVVVIVAPEEDTGVRRPSAKRIDPVRLGTWAINSAAAGERRPDRAGLGAQETWLKVLATAGRESHGQLSVGEARNDPTTLALNNVFAEGSIRLARRIARLHPSAPELDPVLVAAGKSQEAEPIYRPFPKSTSTFFSPASTDGPKSQPTQPDLPVVAAVPSMSTAGAESSPEGTDWAAFSSFGFDGSSPARHEPKALELGAGLELDLGSAGGPPRRLNARSLELERILQGADAASPPQQIDALPDRPAEAPRAQLLGVSLLFALLTLLLQWSCSFADVCLLSDSNMSEAFPAVLAHKLLDPNSADPTLPIVAAFEIYPSILTDAKGPRWVLVALATPAPATKLASAPELAPRLPALGTARSSGTSSSAPSLPPTARRKSGSTLTSFFSVNPFGRRQSIKTPPLEQSVDRANLTGGRLGNISLPQSQVKPEQHGSDARASTSTSAAPSSRLPVEAPVSLDDRLGAVIDIGRAPSRRPREDGTWTPPALPANIDGLTQSPARNGPGLAIPSAPGVLNRSVRESAPSPEVRPEALPTPPAHADLVSPPKAVSSRPSDQIDSPAVVGPGDAANDFERLTLDDRAKVR